MSGIRVMASGLLAAALAAAVASAGWAGDARAADLFSLEARLMAVEARLRDLSTFRQPQPAPTSANEVLRQRIQVLELSLAEARNVLGQLQKDVDGLKGAKRP